MAAFAPPLTDDERGRLPTLCNNERLVGARQRKIARFPFAPIAHTGTVVTYGQRSGTDVAKIPPRLRDLPPERLLRAKRFPEFTVSQLEIVSKIIDQRRPSIRINMIAIAFQELFGDMYAYDLDNGNEAASKFG